MRVNLDCPYAEKDQAKSMGARWDAALRVWYVKDVEDLTPFMRWLGPQPKPTLTQKKSKPKPVVLEMDDEINGVMITRQFIQANKTRGGSWMRAQLSVIGVAWPPRNGWIDRVCGNVITHKQAQVFMSFAGPKYVTTTSTVRELDCDCNVLPWEDCDHTDRAAERAFNEMNT